MLTTWKKRTQLLVIIIRDNKKNPIKGMNDSPQKCFRKRGKKYITARDSWGEEEVEKTRAKKLTQMCSIALVPSP